MRDKDPQSGRVKLVEKYSDCESCFGANPDESMQRTSKCSHPMFSPGKWNDSNRHLAIYMGGAPTRATQYPAEPHLPDGCPGGWYRCPWFYSVAKYHGDSVAYEMPDRIVADAVTYYQGQRYVASQV